MQVVSAYKSDDGNIYADALTAKAADIKYYLDQLRNAADDLPMTNGTISRYLAADNTPTAYSMKEAIVKLYELTR